MHSYLGFSIGQRICGLGRASRRFKERKFREFMRLRCFPKVLMCGSLCLLVGVAETAAQLFSQWYTIPIGNCFYLKSF
ncbi:hypothetical protein LOK49_LG06G00728 [Camellia lanceoleosa]|uniref:Uncharacterized protein n=2 Tax=Camellia lanceoleosa TaxID=1840588 RepID=A0ACC0HCH1_9ERIC|nr:hypothetical protein LOK49_LG06G00738 [Camellia lanceoleosa]KAI8012583.1 hypothetical protein LOK49_LG06G00728 [Camellia lanceoleosa]